MANSNKQERTQLYEWFETGDRPNQLQFQDFIDSMIIQDDDEVWVENDDADYPNYLGIGTTSPVGRVSISGETVIGGGFASDRSIPASNLPADGLVVEGDVKIGTHGTNDYRVEIKSRTSTNVNNPHQRAMLIDSANHTMMVFRDTTGNTTDPFTVIDEKNMGVRFWKYGPSSPTGSHTLLYMAPDGKVGIHQDNPTAKLDIAAFGDAGIKVDTNHENALIFADGNATPNPAPFTLRETANRGFRFYTDSASYNQEHLRITPDGKVGINTTTPSEKLEIEGSMAIRNGHIFGKRDNNNFTLYANTNSLDGGHVEMAAVDPTPGSLFQGQLLFASVGTGPLSGFHFVQKLLTGAVKRPLIIDPDSNLNVKGKIGIEVNGAPSNLLDIDSPGVDTGLRLRSGSAEQMVLGSDAIGNASWMALSAFTSSGAVPFGAIIMWWNASNIPGGWALCDGLQHAKSDGTGNVTTPNMMGKFVVGYFEHPTLSAPYNYDVPGAMGGEDEVILKAPELPEHHHTLTPGVANVTDGGGHSHGLKNLVWRPGSQGVNGGLGLRRGDNSSPDPFGSNTDPVDDHSHGIDGQTDKVGNNQAHENRPSYVVVAYIMKV